MRNDTTGSKPKFVIDTNGVLIEYNGIAKDVVIPKGVREIGEWAFNNCHLNTVMIPEGVEIIGEWAFRENNLKTVIFPKTLKIIKKGAFYSNELTEIFFQAELELISKWAFYNNQLTKVNFWGEIADIEPGAFDNMNEISFVEKLPSETEKILNDTLILQKASSNFNTFNHEEISGETTNISPYKIDSGGVLYEYEGDNIDVIIPNGVKEVGEWAFTNCNVRSVVIPEGVIKIDEWAFQQNQIEEITLPQSLEIIDKGAFYKNNLKKVILPSNLKKIAEFAFHGNDVEEVVFFGDLSTLDPKSFDNMNKIVFVNSNSELDKGNETGSNSEYFAREQILEEIKAYDFQFTDLFQEIKKNDDSYKYLLFKVVLELNNKNNHVLSFNKNDLIIGMIGEAWQLIVKFNFSFGIRDNMKRIIDEIIQEYSLSTKADFRQIMTILQKNKEKIGEKYSVLFEEGQYQLLLDYFTSMMKKNRDVTDNTVFKILSNSKKSLYLIDKDRKNMILNQKYRLYLSENYETINEWYKQQFWQYLQVNNSIIANQTNEEFISQYVNKEVELPALDDPNLTSALKKTFAEKGLPFTQASAKKIEELDLSSQKITTIVGISVCENLQTLRINNNKLKDLSPLTELKNLTVIEANANEIESIDMLVNCKKLLRISVRDNPIKNWPNFAAFYNNPETTHVRGFEITFEPNNKSVVELAVSQKPAEIELTFNQKIQKIKQAQTSAELYPFLDDKNTSVRIMLAESKVADEKIFSYLIAINDYLINRVILKNKNLPQQLRNKIEDKVSSTTSKVEKEGNKSGSQDSLEAFNYFQKIKLAQSDQSEYYEALARDKEIVIRKRLLENPLISRDVLAILAQDKVSIIAKQAQNKLQAWQERENPHAHSIETLTREQKINLAKSAKTEFYDQLAKDQNIGVRLALAENQLVPSEILRQLVDDQYAVISEQAKRALQTRLQLEVKSDEQKIPEYLKSLDKEQKITLARSQETKYFSFLAHDINIEVRLALVGNDSIPDEILEFLAKDFVGMISQKAKTTLKKRTDRKRGAETVLEKTTVVQEPRKLDTSKIPAQKIEAINRIETKQKIALATSQNIDFFEMLAKDERVEVRLALAGNHFTPAKILRELMQDQVNLVAKKAEKNLQRVLENENQNSNIDENVDVQTVNINAPKIPEPKQEELSEEQRIKNFLKTVEYQHKLRLAKSTQSKYYQHLAKDSSDEVRLALVENPRISTNELLLLVQDQNAEIAQKAQEILKKRQINIPEKARQLESRVAEADDTGALQASNETIPLEAKVHLSTLTKEQRVALAKSTESQYFELLARDASIGVRFELVKNPDVPKSVIELLAKDHVQLIAERAREVLESKRTNLRVLSSSKANLNSQKIEQKIETNNSFDMFADFDDLSEPIELFDIDDL